MYAGPERDRPVWRGKGVCCLTPQLEPSPLGWSKGRKAEGMSLAELSPGHVTEFSWEEGGLEALYNIGWDNIQFFFWLKLVTPKVIGRPC